MSEEYYRSQLEHREEVSKEMTDMTKSVDEMVEDFCSEFPLGLFSKGDLLVLAKEIHASRDAEIERLKEMVTEYIDKVAYWSRKESLAAADIKALSEKIEQKEDSIRFYIKNNEALHQHHYSLKEKIAALEDKIYHSTRESAEKIYLLKEALKVAEECLKEIEEGCGLHCEAFDWNNASEALTKIREIKGEA